MFTYRPYIITAFELLLLLLFGNDHENKYFVPERLPDSSRKHKSYPLDSNLIDFDQPVHALHESEDENEGESAV